MTRWARVAAPAVLGLAGAVVVACTIDVPIEGKRCPCAEGYDCDEAFTICVPHRCDPAVTATDLVAAWVTPNAIAYRWTPSTQEGLFGSEILVAETLEDLAAFAASAGEQAGNVRRITAAENPELGVPTSNPWTIVRGLDPAKAYYARVLVTDTASCSAGSNVVAAQTPIDAAGFINLFDDTLTPPAFTQPTAGMAVTGGELVYTPAEDAECEIVPGADLVCGQPLRVAGLSIPLNQPAMELPGLDDKAFTRAFIEARLENVGDEPSSFAEVFLRFRGCVDVENDVYEIAGFTLPAHTGYQIVQLPLAELSQANRPPGTRTPLTFADVDTQAGGTAACGFGIGAQWNKAGRVRIDYVKVRY